MRDGRHSLLIACVWQIFRIEYGAEHAENLSRFGHSFHRVTLWKNLFDGGDFMPHGHCYLWLPGLIRLHLLTDLAIGLAYITISCTLAYLVSKAKKDVPFSWIFLCFGVFIIACGATHLMEIWTLWVPVYWLSGTVKLVTALASVATAIVLPPLIPKSLAMIRSAKLWEHRQVELEEANEAMQKEIGERISAEAE